MTMMLLRASITRCVDSYTRSSGFLSSIELHFDPLNCIMDAMLRYSFLYLCPVGNIIRHDSIDYLFDYFPSYLYKSTPHLT